MKLIVCLMVFHIWIYLIFEMKAQVTGQYDVRQYNDRYLRNREIFNRRRYYENFYKKYNPDIEAKEAHIVEQSSVPIQEDGSYAFKFETDNGIHNEAQGTALTLKNGDQVQKVEGSFSYVTPEGVHVTIKYVADEKGYRPVINYDFFDAKQVIRSEPVATKNKT